MAQQTFEQLFCNIYCLKQQQHIFFSEPFIEETQTDETNEDASKYNFVEFESNEESNELLDALDAELDDETEPAESEDKFNIWCVCHRLQLVLKDLTANVDKFKELKKVILKNSFNFLKFLACIYCYNKVC